MTRISIDRLPNELLVKIFKNLDIYDRMKCQAVCHRWRSVVQVSTQDIKVFSFGHHWPVCKDRAHSSQNRGQNQLLPWKEESGHLLRVISFLPNLKCLNIYLRDGRSVKALKNCSRLECLTLISYRDEVMINALPMICHLGESLRHLKLCDESRAIRRLALDKKLELMLSKCQKLTVFHLNRMHLSGEAFEAMSPVIREISAQIGQPFVGSLTGRTHRHLESLMIRNSILNSRRMEAVCDYFSGLKSLFIESYTDCEDFAFCLFIGRMKRLKVLEVSFVPKLYNTFFNIDQQLIHIFENCPKMKKMTLCNCINATITDEFLLYLANHCPNFGHLHLWRFGDMQSVSVEAIEAFLVRCPVSHCTLEALFFDRRVDFSEIWVENVQKLNPHLKFAFIFDQKLVPKSRKCDPLL